jgi:hypothetical protein
MRISFVRVLSALLLIGIAPVLGGANGDGCNNTPNSDNTQREAQEKILAEGTSQVGMPAIKNFRERKLLKNIYELRDQSGLVTYSYLTNMNPTVVKGRTALGGKLVFFCDSFGYPIPYSTQFTNPQKDIFYGTSSSVHMALPQADPNGLFSPPSTDGTWVMCKDPNPDGKDVKPIHVEDKVIGSPFKFPMD